MATLKTMREKAGLRQEQIADYLNVTQDFLSKVETGERNLTVDQLESIANLYTVFANMVEDALPMQAQDINPEDLRSIADIERIAMNSRFMKKALEGEF